MGESLASGAENTTRTGAAPLTALDPADGVTDTTRSGGAGPVVPDPAPAPPEPVPDCWAVVRWTALPGPPANTMPASAAIATPTAASTAGRLPRRLPSAAPCGFPNGAVTSRRLHDENDTRYLFALLWGIKERLVRRPCARDVRLRRRRDGSRR